MVMVLLVDGIGQYSTVLVRGVTSLGSAPAGPGNLRLRFLLLAEPGVAMGTGDSAALVWGDLKYITFKPLAN